MKKFTSLSLLLFLMSISVQSMAGEALVNTVDWRRISRGVEIRIECEGSARFVTYEVKEPAQIIVDFLGENTYCSLQDEVIVESGTVERVQAVGWSEDRTDNRYPLDFLVIDLIAAVPYEVRETEKGISVTVMEPEEEHIKEAVHERKMDRGLRKEAERLRERLKYIKYHADSEK